MLTEQEIKKIIAEILSKQQLGVLATYEGQIPYTSLIAFYAEESLGKIYFTTLRATQKYTNISMYENVSILIDTRTNSLADFKEAKALTVLGKAHEMVQEKKQVVTSLYLEKYPHLSEFVNDHDCAIIVIDVIKYILVTDFQKVYELNMNNKGEAL